MFIILEIGVKISQTWNQLLATRALYGIAMSGLYGNVAATALEDSFGGLRIISGLLQLVSRLFIHSQRPWHKALSTLLLTDGDYSIGSLLAPPVILIIIPLYLPETNAFKQLKMLREGNQGNLIAIFLSEGKMAVKRHWPLLIYLVLFIAGTNFTVSSPKYPHGRSTWCTQKRRHWPRKHL